MVGDSHKQNNRGLYTHYEDSLWKVGWVYPQCKEFISRFRCSKQSILTQLLRWRSLPLGQALNFINKARYLSDGLVVGLLWINQNHPAPRPYMCLKQKRLLLQQDIQRNYNLPHLDEENLTFLDVDRNKSNPSEWNSWTSLTSRPCVKWRERILAAWGGNVELNVWIPPNEKLGTQWSKYMAQSPKGRLKHGLYKPIHGNCAIYLYLGVISSTSSSSIRKSGSLTRHPLRGLLL